MGVLKEGSERGEKRKRKIAVQSGDQTSLLVDFLNEALTAAQINREVYDRAVFRRFSETELEAELEGAAVGSFDEGYQGRHLSRSGCEGGTRKASGKRGWFLIYDFELRKAYEKRIFVAVGVSEKSTERNFKMAGKTAGGVFRRAGQVAGGEKSPYHVGAAVAGRRRPQSG